ncbi:MAG: 2Fe-2S iron-sulfur cluster-binding protein [Desulfotignum sp.]|nr:(2Fe-2S)-binding protein [Desulfobacteraceae bacterium]
MIEIIINDRAVVCKEGQTVLEVAKSNDIDIPHLCFHPALKPSGACRVCGVEITSNTGRQTVMLSCLLKVKPGLNVVTDSPLVQTHRQNAFVRLYRMAPQAHRIRDMAHRYQVDLPPEPDGCIRCRLCIRVCQDIVKVGALKMEKTDSDVRVVKGNGQCVGCGTCANICPTGIIQVTDQDNVRTISIQDRIIGQLPLERCEGCGCMYATADFLNRVSHINPEHPDTKEHHHLCPACTKRMSTRATTEKAHIKK